MFRGSFVALITPMLANGDVDYPSLNRLVEFHITAGTDGIVSVGTTGESATLSFEQHVDVVKATVAAVNGRCKIVVGSGANSTEESLFLQNETQDLGIDGFLSVVPYYNKPQQRGMVAHFTVLADAANVPVILYNVPGRTVADMQPETVAILAQHPNIIGIKDATGDMQRLKDTQSLVPADFLILSGDDATGCEFMNLGGHGVISVTANIVPKQMKMMCDAALSGNISGSKQIDDSIVRLHTDLFIESNPVIPKWALYKMGLITSPELRLPLVQAELCSQSLIEQTLKDYQLL
ncbi:MAG: 4-hydroxy-tetrahydrodipicolinate synthase [Glaciecola sp.]|nr:4-hydroxy-tetrahydrodipicolinate synthase [Glaciecola sp.]MDG1468884.1 4-hydroxy-tetrahydrodipicolinate synthase [Glaciecola sp.]